MPALKPVTPGELLLEEFLVPMQLSQYRLAKEIGVSAQRIGEIVAGKRAITADSDLRLCRFFGLSNGYWLRAQVAHTPRSPRRRWRRYCVASSRGPTPRRNGVRSAQHRLHQPADRDREGRLLSPAFGAATRRSGFTTPLSGRGFTPLFQR